MAQGHPWRSPPSSSGLGSERGAPSPVKLRGEGLPPPAKTAMASIGPRSAQLKLLRPEPQREARLFQLPFGPLVLGCSVWSLRLTLFLHQALAWEFKPPVTTCSNPPLAAILRPWQKGRRSGRRACQASACRGLLAGDATAGRRARRRAAIGWRNFGATGASSALAVGNLLLDGGAVPGSSLRFSPAGSAAGRLATPLRQPGRTGRGGSAPGCCFARRVEGTRSLRSVSEARPRLKPLLCLPRALSPGHLLQPPGLCWNPAPRGKGGRRPSQVLRNSRTLRRV